MKIKEVLEEIDKATMFTEELFKYEVRNSLLIFEESEKLVYPIEEFSSREKFSEYFLELIEAGYDRGYVK